jgi:hypothetical protein
MLATLDAPDAERQIEREWLRGQSALGSLRRLGLEASAIDTARRTLDEFARRELPGIPGRTAAHASADGPRPRRLLRAPLHYQRHLLEGWRALPRDVRERWIQREGEVKDAALLAEIAWYACDGTRDLGDITRLVWLETGRDEPEFLREFFELTARLGLSDHASVNDEEPCRSDEPRTASR